MLWDPAGSVLPLPPEEPSGHGFEYTYRTAPPFDLSRAQHQKNRPGMGPKRALVTPVRNCDFMEKIVSSLPGASRSHLSQ